MVNSQKEAGVSQQFASVSSDVKFAAPASVNPKQLSEMHQDSLLGQSVNQAPPDSQLRRSSVASLAKASLAI